MPDPFENRNVSALFGTEFRFQVGKTYLTMSSQLLPPIGTRIPVHKHLTEDGGGCTVEVTGHDWSIDDTTPDDLPVFKITVHTRIVK